jgi:hypothetical protein
VPYLLLLGAQQQGAPPPAAWPQRTFLSHDDAPPAARPRAGGQQIDKRQNQKRSCFLLAREILLARIDKKKQGSEGNNQGEY